MASHLSIYPPRLHIITVIATSTSVNSLKNTLDRFFASVSFHKSVKSGLNSMCPQRQGVPRQSVTVRKVCLPQLNDDDDVRQCQHGHTSITEKFISTSDMIKPPHPTISCECVTAIILKNKRQNTRNNPRNILST